MKYGVRYNSFRSVCLLQPVISRPIVSGQWSKRYNSIHCHSSMYTIFFQMFLVLLKPKWSATNRKFSKWFVVGEMIWERCCIHTTYYFIVWRTFMRTYTSHSPVVGRQNSTKCSSPFDDGSFPTVHVIHFNNFPNTLFLFRSGHGQ